MRRYVWSRNLVNEEVIARVGPQCHRNKKICCSISINTIIIIADNNTNNNDNRDIKQQCGNRAKLDNLTCICPPLLQPTAQNSIPSQGYFLLSPRSSEWIFCCVFPKQNCARIICLSCTMHATSLLKALDFTVAIWLYEAPRYPIVFGLIMSILDRNLLFF